MQAQLRTRGDPGRTSKLRCGQCRQHAASMARTAASPSSALSSSCTTTLGGVGGSAPSATPSAGDSTATRRSSSSASSTASSSSHGELASAAYTRQRAECTFSAMAPKGRSPRRSGAHQAAHAPGGARDRTRAGLCAQHLPRQHSVQAVGRQDVRVPAAAALQRAEYALLDARLLLYTHCAPAASPPASRRPAAVANNRHPGSILQALRAAPLLSGAASRHRPTSSCGRSPPSAASEATPG